MDLVICQPELSLGGAEKVILEIAKRFNPVLYVLRYDRARAFPEFSEFDIRVPPTNLLDAPATAFAGLDRDARARLFASAGARFLGMKIKGSYDVINAHLAPSEWVRNRNERVVWYCNSIFRPAYEWTDYFMGERGIFGKAMMGTAIRSFRLVERCTVPRIESIVANSEFTDASIRKYFRRESCAVIPPAINPKDFGCDDYEKFFFYPSRIVPEKRMEIAIDAFRKFGRKGWKLVVGGSLAPTPRNLAYFERLKALSRGLNVDFVTDLGERELAGLYANCHATLFAAMNEDWGIVPLESMAACKPCISVNEGGPRESIVDGKTGFLVNSVEEMAGKMRFLSEHPDINEKMGRAGRKRVEQNYTWKIFLDKIGKVFRKTAKM